MGSMLILRNKVMAGWNQLTNLATKVSSMKTSGKAQDSKFYKMVTTIMENGLMIRKKALAECTTVIQAAFMRVTGPKMNAVEKVS